MPPLFERSTSSVIRTALFAIITSHCLVGKTAWIVNLFEEKKIDLVHAQRRFSEPVRAVKTPGLFCFRARKASVCC